MYLNPIEYNGYLITVTAFQTAEGAWQGAFTARKENEASIEETTVATFDTSDEAAQYAYALARKVLW
jgi:hypothetical protein